MHSGLGKRSVAARNHSTHLQFQRRLPVLGVYAGRALHFFLHGYGRYVCREAQVTLDDFEESDERIRARTKEANPPRPNHQNKQAHPNSPPKETETELAHIRLKCGKSEDPEI